MSHSNFRRILLRGILWGQHREDAADAAQVRQLERDRANIEADKQAEAAA